MRRTIARTVTATTVTFALLAVGLPTASAARDSTDSTARLVAEAAPGPAEVLAGQTAGEALNIDGALTATIPLDATSPITIAPIESDETHPANSAPTSLAVSLPEGLGLTDGEVAADGSVVYRSEAGSTDVAVQALDTGELRVATILNDKNAPTNYEYALPDGVDARVLEDGSVLLGRDGYAVGSVAAPWATDANGEAVPTHYAIANGSLLQTISTTPDTVFPVVADPAWKWWGAQYTFTARQANALLVAVGGGGSVAGVVAALAGAGIVTAPVAAAAGFVAAVMALGSVAIGYCASPGKGLYLNFFYTGIVTCTQRR
ncbi:hypothetical protein [Oerskovia enterophila]|uniref:Uncharacterized protein n=1 Tax=Oerskovia enterophila TaxID=43678 RepID=A0A161YIL4_9CELL|nr:hypothetical protein [Oerskovia enterophila]KZM36068.1 hypothetical protein OJAG_12720 [Oerskovia enterophila]OCI32318.1 hypothetical protein OERS_09270 [Oerskovia enterophila]